MSIALKSVTTAGNNGSTATVSVVTSETPAATMVGDLVVVIHGNDFYTLANMVTPTATGLPTMNAITNGTVDAGTNQAHIKAYWYVANTAGAQTISTTETGSHDEEKCLVAFVLSGADTTTPIDGGSAGAAGNFSATNANPHIAPAVIPVGADAFLICHVNTGGGLSTTSYTPPAGMTEQYDGLIGAGINWTGATLQLSGSGSTGTKTFTPAAGNPPYAALSLAIKTATGGGGSGSQSESVAIADSVSVHVDRARAQAETVTTADVVARVSTRSRAQAETIATADAVARASTRARALAEAVALADATAATGSRARALSEAVTVSDVTSGATGGGLARSQAETVSAADAVARRVQLQRAVPEPLAVSDAVARATAEARATTDAVTVADTTSRRTALPRALGESVTLGDLVARGVALVRQLLEAVHLVDVTTSSTPNLVPPLIRRNAIWLDDPAVPAGATAPTSVSSGQAPPFTHETATAPSTTVLVRVA